MASSLFTYGTLLFPEIMEAVIGRSLPSTPATLHGYQCYYVRDCVYPGLRVEQRSLVDGRLYTGLRDDLWQRLDAFEGARYERVEVPIVVNRALKTAQVYFVKASYEAELSNDVWDAEVFKTIHKRSYLAACRQTIHAGVASRQVQH